MQITRKAFDHMVEAAIESLPAAYAQWIEEVPVIVEDRPSMADLEGAGESEEQPLGMFIGRAVGEDVEDSGTLAARIMLYREPLIQACKDGKQLAEEIRRTLIHELGHYAGMDEADLDAHGFGDMEDDIDSDGDK
jgi:predicted Zn-dependent protease with MMP-like domain